MIKIGGGKYRSRNIEVPSYLDVPTKNIVRLAIFNSLTDKIHNARVLDAFSGSGALGFEALSRGASFVTFIDKEKASIEVIKKNAESLKEHNYEAILCDALEAMKKFDKPYDIIILDPPYKDEHCYVESLTIIKEKKLLKEDGILVIEYENDYPIFKEIIGKTYKYGKTKVLKGVYL